jgi:hypothetical protein
VIAKITRGFVTMTHRCILFSAVLCLWAPPVSAQAPPAPPSFFAETGITHLNTADKSLAAQDIIELPWRGILIGADHGPTDTDIFYDDFYVQIDDGPMIYYTTAPVRMQWYAGASDPGVLGHFFSRDQATYSIYITATDYAMLTSDLSDPFTVHFNYGSFSCSKQTVPVADAGPDQVVKADTEVTLDGGGSYDPYGPDTIGLVYRWECYSAPEPVTLSDDGQAAVVSFSPHTNGQYYFRFNVRDVVDGSSFNRSQVAYTRIAVVADPDDPDLLDANAGPVQEAEAGETVVLDGSRSRVTAGSSQYHWEQTNPVGVKELSALAEALGTTGCTTGCYTANFDADTDVDGSDLALLARNWGAVTLTDSDQPVAHFTAGIARPHIFALTVNDGVDSKTESTIVAVHHPNVSALLTPPEADSNCTVPF